MRLETQSALSRLDVVSNAVKNKRSRGDQAGDKPAAGFVMAAQQEKKREQ
jgi:hypothetical protein